MLMIAGGKGMGGDDMMMSNRDMDNEDGDLYAGVCVRVCVCTCGSVCVYVCYPRVWC